MEGKTNNIVNIKFEGEIITVKMPQHEGFTGQIEIVLHWLHGKIKKGEVSKKSSVELTQDT